MPNPINGNLGGQQIPSILPPHTDPATLSQPTHPNQGNVTNPPNPPTIPPENTPQQQLPTSINEQFDVLGPVDDCQRSVSVVFFEIEEFLGIMGGISSTLTVNVFVNGLWSGSQTVPIQFFPIVIPFPVLETLEIAEAVVEVPFAGCSPNVSDLVQVSVTAGGQTSALSAGVRVESHVKYNVLTQHYDNARSGWQQYETQLNAKLLDPKSNPNPFIEQFQLPVDGKVYAQPLYMHHVNFPGLGAKNVVFLATENDTVYAYDADDPKAVLLWQRSLLQPGERPVDSNGDIGCGDITPTVGVSSTPVISCGCADTCGGGSGCGCEDSCGSSSKCCGSTMYVVSKSVTGTVPGDSSNTFHLYLHALDVITGQERPNSPVEISGEVKGEGAGSVNGVITFDPKIQNVRPGLLLEDGCIYIGAASHCDNDNYHGWVFAYDATSLRRKAIFCTTPDGVTPTSPYLGIQGGIWQSGQGIASDGDAIYFTTGNGGYALTDPNPVKGKPDIVVGNHNSYDANVGGNNYGNSVLKLSLNLRVRSFFTPQDQWTLDIGDIDLGSGGVMVLPPQLGAHPNLVVTLGKDGMIFLLDRDGLGGFAGDAPHPPAAGGFYGTNPNAVFTIFSNGQAALPYANSTIGSAFAGGIWGGPSYYHGVDGNGNDVQYVFYAAIKLSAFLLNNGALKFAGSSTPRYDAQAGTTPVVSSNSQETGSPIVWVVDRAGTGGVHLHAYLLDTSLATPIASTPIADVLIGAWTEGRAFLVPTVVNGKVYVASQDHVGVFYCANETKVY